MSGHTGVEEPRGSETQRLTASAKCRGCPESLEQHVVSPKGLFQRHSAHAEIMKMIFKVLKVLSFEPV